MNSSKKNKRKHQTDSYDASLDSSVKNDLSAQDDVSATPSKKKTKRKYEANSFDADPDSSVNLDQSAQNDLSSKKKNKRKHEANSFDANLDSSVNPKLAIENDLSVVNEKSVIKESSSRKKNKRQHQTDSDETELNPLVENDPLATLNPLPDPPMPSKEILNLLLDRIKAQLPNNDNLRFDTRVKRLDWSKIEFDELSGEDCQKCWNNIQGKIRHFRIMEELIQDAQNLIMQPMCGKSNKDIPRHPDMPKNPLTSYFLYYHDKRKQIAAENPSLTMPEISKLCSAKWKSMSDKKKAKYKQRSDEDFREYREKLGEFYLEHPDQKPVKTKVKKNLGTSGQKLQMQQPQQHQQTDLFLDAPEKPAKPFDLFMKHKIDSHPGEPNYDRLPLAKVWKNLKLKKKGKWIKKAAAKIREYEEVVNSYCAQNPGYVRPEVKNLLSKEERRILDQVMGRPEKPPPSGYGMFFKEKINCLEIKTITPRERMGKISVWWNALEKQQQDRYQEEANRLTSEYTQEYEAWLNNLTDLEREAETLRGKPKPTGKPAKSKPKRKPAAKPVTNPVMEIPKPQSAISNGREDLLTSVLERQPIQPPSSPKGLFVQDYLGKHKKKTKADAKEIWRQMEKKERKKWSKLVEPKRLEYCNELQQFYAGLNKEEKKAFKKYKQKKEEESEKTETNNSSDTSDTE